MSNRRKSAARGARSKSTSSKQKIVGELLERRIVLSGTHDAALIAAIDSALQSNSANGLAAFATRLDDASAIGRSFPLVGGNLGTHYDPGQPIRSNLTRLGTSYATFAALTTALEGSAGLADGINVTASRDNLDNLELDVHFNSTTGVNVPINGTYGINLSISGSVSMLEVLDFQLTIGAYWDSTSSSAVFYVSDTNDVLQISSSVTSASLTPTGSLGFVDLSVTGASASFAPTFNFNLIDQATPGQPTRVTQTQLSSVSVPSLVATNVVQAGATALTVNFNAALAPTAHGLAVSWADLTQPTSATSTLNTDPTLSQLAAYQAIQPVTYSSGLDSFVQTIGEATTTALTPNSPFTQTMPLLGQSFGDVLNAQTLLTSALTSHTDTTLDAQNHPVLQFTTANQLLSLLQNLSGVGPSHATLSTSAGDIRYALTIPASSSQSLPLSLGIDSQLNLPVTSTMTVTATTTTTVTFGVNTANQFFIIDTGAPLLNATLGGTAAINTATNLGFLGVTIAAGTASLAATGTLALKDPQTDSPATPGVISTNELTGANVNAMAVPTVTGTASASLPLSTNLSAMTGVTGTLGVTWPDVKAPQTFTLNTAPVSQFVGFNNITPAVAINGLTALPAVLNHVGDAAYLGENLGFLGSSIGSSQTLGTLFQNVVTAVANIHTAQDLQNALNAQLGASNVSVTITASDIEFSIAQTQAMPQLKWSLNVTEPTSALGFQSSSTISPVGTYTTNLQFGLGFGAALSATDRFYVLTGAGSKVSASFKLNSTLFSAGASLGYLQVGITNGSATVTSAANSLNPATVAVPVVVPGGGSQLTLTKIQANSAAAPLGTPVTDAKVQLTMPISSLPAPGTSPQIGVTWNNAAVNPPAVIAQGLGDLSTATNYNPTTALAGIQSVINQINGWGNITLLNTNIPLVGLPIKSVFNFIQKGTSFFQAIITGGTSNGTAFNNSVTNAIATAGLDAGSVTLTAQADNDPANGVFHYLLNFHYNTTGISEPFNFGTSLFTINKAVTVGVQFNANIEFGLSKAAGFYIVDRSAAASPEVSLTTSVTAVFNQVGGNFGPLQYGIANGNATIAFNAGLDLVSPNGPGGKIGTGDLSNNLGAVAVPEFLPGSGGTLDLPIGLFLGVGGPGVATEFKANWNPINPGALFFGTGQSTNPVDGFGPVEFELGDYFTGIINPVLQNIQQFNPLPQKLIDILDFQLPLIDKTPIQILGDFSNQSKIILLFKIAEVLSQAQAIVGGGTLNLSDYFATAPNTGTKPNVAGQGGTPAEQNPFSSLLTTLRNDGLTFPLLDNPGGSVISMLLGQNVKLIEYNPGRFEVKKSLSSPKITIPVFSIGFLDASVTAQIGGSVGFFANVDIGLDTSGLTGNTIDHTHNLLDGFFIGDSDRFQVGFEGRVFLDLGGQIDAFGFPLVNVYGRLGLSLDLGLHVNDVRYSAPGVPVAYPGAEVEHDQPGGDGRTTLDELNYLLGTYGFNCTLQFGGQLSLFGGIGFKGPSIPLLGNIPDIYTDIGSIPIIDFEVPCDPPPAFDIADIVGNSLVMNPDSSTTGEHIEANVYYDQNQNPAGVSITRHVASNPTASPQHKEFTFAQLSAAGVNTLIIEGTNGDDNIQIDPALTKVYGFKFIVVNSHNGNDSVKFGDIDPLTSMLLGTTINAGDGNDTLNGTFAPDSIVAGNGNDAILGGPGNDSITTGNGASTISGGAGNDFISAGNGANNITVGDGNSTVFVGGGGNILTGGNGNNTIHGGSGGDKYRFENGNNSLLAGSGSDVIYTGDGANYISTGLGNDFVQAGQGNNTIQGGAGNDTLTAGDGNNNIFGVGNNTIKAGQGKNYVSAGPGNNIINLGDGDNKVIAGNGANYIATGHGQDIVQAGTGPDTILTGAGDDFITVAGGNDDIDAGGGNNLLVVTADANFTLSNGAVAVGTHVVNFANVQRLTLTGGASANTFTVSAWTGKPVILNGNGSLDTVISTDDTNFVLAANSLTRSDNTSFTLNGISQAILTGGISDNSFDISTFVGPVTIDGGVGTNDYNRIIDSVPGAYTLTNGALIRSGGSFVTLSHINRATLPPGSNTSAFSGLVDSTTGGPPVTLPTSTDSFGRWSELGQSASNGGISSSTGSAIEPSIATSASAQFVAWADNRGGVYQIYVAEHTAAGWIQLANSAQGAGISNTAGDSRRPSITLDASGNPIVAWTVYNGTSTNIEVATFTGGAWVAIGTSMGALGISGTNTADNAQVVNTTSGPVVSWLDRTSGVSNIFVKRFSGGSWTALGTGAASSGGVSGSAIAVPEYSLSTDGTNVALAWTQPIGGATQIFLEQFSGSVWSAVNGSTNAGGISNTAGAAAQPSVAYTGGTLYVAFQATVNGQSNVAAVAASGLAWIPISIDTPASAGNSVTRGAASFPQLEQAGGTLELVWLERRIGGLPSQDTAIYATRLTNAGFVRTLPGDASNNGIYFTSSAITSPALSVDSSGRPFVAWGDSTNGSPQIYALGATFAIHNVYYVNDGLTKDDTFTTAPGAAANTGLTASAPLDSVQSVLTKYALVAGDVILVDSGTYVGFTLSSNSNGILILGSSGVPSVIATGSALSTTQNLILQGLQFTAGLTVTSGTNVQLSNDTISSLTLTGGTGDRVEHSTLSSLVLGGSISNASVVNNQINGAVTLSGTTGLVLSGNRITNGISVSTASAGTITNNDVSSSGTALNLLTAFTGSIDHNSIHNSSLGVNYATATTFNANRVYSNTTGITDSVAGAGGLGFTPGSVSNDIYNNTTGVNLTGSMQLQHIFGNTTGVIGSGVLGPATLDNANLIEMNATGVNFTGTIQHNRIDRNTIGIKATNTQTIIHNLIYRNVSQGIEAGGVSDVRIISNTFYATSGNNIQVDLASSNVQSLDNILWNTGGYDLYVADDSRTGFFSDYNDLYATGAGRIVHWLADFTDILDWQVNVNRFDLHSIGVTSVNPTWAQPQFVNLSRDNFVVNGLAGAMRSSSPTLDNAAPFTDTGLPTSYVNLLTNPSFDIGGVAGWTANVGGTTLNTSPAGFNGANYFFPGSVASGFAQQTLSLTGAGFTTAQLDGQGLALVFGGRVRASTADINDQTQIVLTFLDGSNTVIGSDTVTASNTSDRWELIGDRLHIPVNARSVTYRFQSVRPTGAPDNAYLDNAFVYVVPATTAPDQGAYGNTTNDADLSTAHLHLTYPDLYVDWERSTPHNITWSTFGSSGSPVNIDLYQDVGGVPTLMLHIATNVVDTGSYTWIPANSGVAFGTYGLRIQISLASNASILDRSTETFVIPESTQTYYVNDGSQTGDVFATAVGNNRNDGALPGKPKPLLTSLLRIYNLGSGNTVDVDTGSYSHFDPVVFSGNPAVGKSQGVTITGPTNPANVAQISSLGFSNQALFDINNGNFVSLNHLSIAGGTYGVWVHNNSSNFSGTYLTTFNNSLDGIRLESDSTAVGLLDHLTSYGNLRDGISIGAQNVNLTNSIAHNNASVGIRYDNAGLSLLSGNESYLNSYGMLITNSVNGTTAIIGSTNLALNLGNRVHDNSLYGIEAVGGVQVAGNTVFNTAAYLDAPLQTILTLVSVAPHLPSLAAGTYTYRVTQVGPDGRESLPSPEQTITVPLVTDPNAPHWAVSVSPGGANYRIYRGAPGNERLLVGNTGFDDGTSGSGQSLPYTTANIYLLNGPTATQNVVYTGYQGIQSTGGAITNNRVFDHDEYGIVANAGATTTGNVVYSNAPGYLSGAGIISFTAPNSATGPAVRNNLVYANGFKGIWIIGGSNAAIENNTVYQLTGNAFEVDPYGGGLTSSNIHLRNNILWSQGGSDIVVNPQSEGGFTSDYNDLYATGAGTIGVWENVTSPTLTLWKLAGFTDGNSISLNPQFVNIAGADGQLGFTGSVDHGSDDDFHEQSTVGSAHGGSLAPTSSGGAVPTALPGSFTADTLNSPAIDRGDPTSSFANEPSPNGGFVNLGAFGNTIQASKTFVPYVLVLSPNGGESLVEGQTFNITWRSEITTGTVSIDLMNGATVVQNIATGIANSGSYAWAIPTSIAPGNYTIRISRTTPSASSDTSDATFFLSGPLHTFYVNDGTVQAGDFTTAAGNDTNSGLDPAHPKASIRALLQAYNFVAGDVIDVDAGTYTLSSNITLPASLTGITIRGFYNAADPTHLTVINRNSTIAGAFTFEFTGAKNMTLDRLSVTGGDIGIYADTSAGSTGMTISNSTILNNVDYGIYLNSGNGNATITGNSVFGGSSTFGQNGGIYSTGNQITVSNNQVYNNPVYGIYIQNGSNSSISGNVVYNNSIGISADTVSISGNIVHDNISTGISVSGNSTVTGNTTYNNTSASGFPRAGIQVYGGTIQGNISYGNVYGIYVSGTGNILNNLLYNNTIAGATFGNGTTFNGNVVYSNGWGVTISSAPNAATRGPGLSNNLFYGNTLGGIDLFGGDITPIYNNTIYQTTGDAIAVVSYGGGLTSNAVDIRNNILWASSGYDLHIDPGAQAAVTADYNDLYVTGTGRIGTWQNIDYSTLATWQLASLEDSNGISTDPNFVNIAGNDFHEQSLFGSFHGGSLAPVLSGVTNLPVPATSTLTNDANQSAAIDRGDPSSAFANETTPNGGFVNLGTYGNTAQASKSPVSYLLVTQPSGGQNWIEGQTFNIKWRDNSIGTGLVDIDLMVQSGATVTLQSNIATGVANNGTFAWNPAASIPPGSNYLIRVTVEGGGASGVSPATFSIAGPTNIYYVNDGTFQAGDWTTAAGNDANSGIDPAHPKASITGVLSAYTIKPGNIIMVDAGTYNLNGDIILTLADSGITIEGYNSASFPTRQAVLNRGNASTGTSIVLDGALNATIDHLGLTGGLYGFASTYQVVSDNATISNCEIFGNSSYAIYLIGGAAGITITGNSIHNDDQGFSSNYNTNVTVTNNTMTALRGRGIELSGSGLISGNTVTNVSGGAAVYAAGSLGNTSVTNNLIHDNGGIGLSISSGVTASGNTIYNQTATGSGFGVQLNGGEAKNNVVYNNYYGIYGSGGGLVDNNRVFNNSFEGIYAYGLSVVSNTVYSNATGIDLPGSAIAQNNLVYANTTRGIYVSGGVAAQILNNTVYQPAGDALVLTSSEGNFFAQHINISNNILWASAGYDLTMTDDAAIGLTSDYNDLVVTGTGKAVRLSTRDYGQLADWMLEYGVDSHSISADPKFINIAGADGILGYSGGVDHGVDDNFHLQSISPAIDAGNPYSQYFNEPSPNGSRINLGNLGNTPQADVTPATQTLQITNPSNLQKLEAGHQYNLTWQTTGISANQPVLLMDTGGPAVGYWNADAYSTVSVSSRTITNTIDASGVSNPAPQQVYQSYSFASPELSYKLPVPNGNYTLKLHFMDDSSYVGQQVMNIKVNGVVVQSNYSPFVAAGGGYKATTLSFNVSASGGTGLQVELVSVSGNAILSGIELTAPNANPVPSPTANLQISTDLGSTWTTIATNQPLDAFGRGSYLWTPTSTSPGATALFRVSINNSAVTGTSQPFAVYGGGANYYVNDSSTLGDSLTTAVGNNANSGKSPNSPLASIQAVIAEYNPGPGGIIHVDAGTYTLVHDILLQASNSGLTIQGPVSSGAAAAVINRGNLANRVFSIQAGASNITFDHLSLTGAGTGIYADYGLNTANITISNNQIYGNGSFGVFVGSGNTGWTISGNTIHDNGGFSFSAAGIDFEGGVMTVTNNTIYNESRYGVYANSLAGTVISGNELYANGIGAQTANTLVSNNRVHDNTLYGIAGYTNSLILGNTIYRQTAVNDAGIYLQGAEARSNVIYYNYNGVVAVGSGNIIDRNRIYSSTNFGVNVQSGGGAVSENLVYANSAAGIVVTGTTGEQITNNTVYQLVGDAVRISSSANSVVQSNILWVEAGFDLNIADVGSQSGFVSNYNDLYKGPGASAHVGNWGVTQDTLANWQAATAARDGNSTSANPNFVSVKGADQVLGYNPAGVGYDGGADDNFYLSASSPAIDRAYTWSGYGVDILNQPRSDDPGTTNAGSANFVPTPLGSSLFGASGSAQNFRTSAQTYFNYTFTGGFTFTFYGVNYTSMQISNCGFLQFAGPDSAATGNNSDAGLIPDVRIAPFWTTLRTDQTGNDIFIDTATAGQLKISWKASNAAATASANFSVVLFSTGQIRFDYGAGNTGFAPTIGISMGDSQHFAFPGIDGSANLSNANSLLFTLPAGYVDMGAYEFQGSSSDVTPPAITATSPAFIQANGSGGTVSQIGLTFSEPLNVIDAQAATDYTLIGAGPDGTFGTADDFTVALTPTYVPGSNTVTLNVIGGPLAPGKYQLTVATGPGAGVHDLAGNLLNGGAAYQKTFTLSLPTQDVITGTAGIDNITLVQDADHTHIDWSMGSQVGQFLVTDPNGLTINGNGSTDNITLLNTNGSPLPNLLNLNGTFVLNGLAGTNPLAGTTLNINASTLFINYGSGVDPEALIRGYLHNGYNGGTWTGTATPGTGSILSTAAAGNAAQTTGIAYLDSADSGGVNPMPNSIELVYALYGDTSAVGTVGFTDFMRMTQHYTQTTGAIWNAGDFNYDGAVGAADFALLQRAYGKTLSAPLPALVTPPPATRPPRSTYVPPPTSVVGPTPMVTTPLMTSIAAPPTTKAVAPVVVITPTPPPAHDVHVTMKPKRGTFVVHPHGSAVKPKTIHTNVFSKVNVKK